MIKLKSFEERISVCLETMDNEIRPGMPGCSPEGLYQKNEVNVNLKCINLLAGYCSYALHHNDFKNIYSTVIGNSEKGYEVEYEAFEDFCDEPYLEMKKKYCDIGTVKQYLLMYSGFTNDTWKVQYNKLVEDTIEYLSTPKVKEAVEFTTKYFIENGCSQIIGKELSDLRSVVEKMI